MSCQRNSGPARETFSPETRSTWVHLSMNDSNGALMAAIQELYRALDWPALLRRLAPWAG